MANPALVFLVNEVKKVQLCFVWML